MCGVRTLRFPRGPELKWGCSICHSWCLLPGRFLCVYTYIYICEIEIILCFTMELVCACTQGNWCRSFHWPQQGWASLLPCASPLRCSSWKPLILPFSIQSRARCSPGCSQVLFTPAWAQPPFSFPSWSRRSMCWVSISSLLGCCDAPELSWAIPNFRQRLLPPHHPSTKHHQWHPGVTLEAGPALCEDLQLFPGILDGIFALVETQLLLPPSWCLLAGFIHVSNVHKNCSIRFRQTNDGDSSVWTLNTY